MSYRIRKVKTSTNKIAIQVVNYHLGKRSIVKHIGSSDKNETISLLIDKASKYISTINGQRDLFPDNSTKDFEIINFHNQYEILGHKHDFIYKTLEYVYKAIGFEEISNSLFKDLCLIRIIKPTSKRESLELLDTYFQIKYSFNNLYKKIKLFYKLKKQTQYIAIEYINKQLKQKLSVVFYDVTTLYFESFKNDELKDLGFSKDNKFNQPQIVVGLVITPNGFPVGYQMFNGKKFEGHTMLPVIKRIVKQYHIDDITIVADAAMISTDNIRNIQAEGYSYIVGARLGNITKTLLNKIINDQKHNGNISEYKTEFGRLVVNFSSKRYFKDKSELEKSIKRANSLIENSSKIISKYKLLKKVVDDKYILNDDLIEKRKKLLGLKGYYTNTKLSMEEVVNQYHNLWRIESDFRVYKSDLKVRPVFHWKPATIQSHLVICFTSLCISKYIEIYTGISVKEFVKKCLHVEDTILLVRKTQSVISITPDIDIKLQNIVQKLTGNLTH